MTIRQLIGACALLVVTTWIPVQAGDEVGTSRQNAITRAVTTCSPAVVGINVTEIVEQQYRSPWDDPYGDPFFDQFFGRPQMRKRRYEVKGLGTGFVISADGYIVTNHHVAGNASKIVVTMTDGSKHNAKLIGSDATTDVALLKMDATKLPYLKMTNSDNVLVGEWAIAFGNPFGLFDINAKPTVTVGVVSNVGVNFSQPNEFSTDVHVYRDMIQTDAAISSGNSGGPLVNALGEVIGMNTVIFSTAQSSRGAGSIGIGYAIPINRVKRIVDRLKEHGVIDRDFVVGFKIDAMDDSVVVTRIESDSPADDAGIEPGDVLEKIDEIPIHREEDVEVAIYDGEVGMKLPVVVRRGGERVTMTLHLRKTPKRGTKRN
jgi:serine protease Do